MRRRVALVAWLAAAWTACTAPYREPCAVESERLAQALPEVVSPAAGAPAMEVLPGGEVRVRWWTAPDGLLPDAGEDAGFTPVAEVATFGDAGAVERVSVPWPADTALGARQALFAGPPLWVDDGAAQVHVVVTASVGADGVQHSRSALRYAHVRPGDGRVEYSEVPGTACDDCWLEFTAQRLRSRVLALSTVINPADPPVGSIPVLAVGIEFDGGTADAGTLPDAGPLWISAASQARNARQQYVVLGPPSMPVVYDETAARVAGPFALTDATTSALDLSTSLATASWVLPSGYVLQGLFEKDGRVAAPAVRVSSGSNVLAVGRSGRLVVTAFSDGSVLYAAVADVSGRKLGGDVLLAGGIPRQVAILPAPGASGTGAFSAWLLEPNALRQIRVRCELGASP